MSEPLSNESCTGPRAAIVAGWYGKLPSLGDFGTRRLPPVFVESWDAWLCDRIAQSQAQLGERWLSLYLTCPIWRFFAMPGAVAPALRECWTGVLMASVDRVGRHFPLTIAAALPASPVTRDEVDCLWQWLADVETVALAALEFDHTTDELDARLAALPVPCFSQDADSGPVTETPLVIADGMRPSDALAGWLAPWWPSWAAGVSMWAAHRDTQPDSDEHSPVAFTAWPTRGLPDTARFAAMLLAGES